MADYWMKLYIEILDDPKMATLSDRVWRRAIELFLVAKRLNKEGALPDTRQIAWMLRMNADELENDMAQIAMTGIVERVVNGWFIPKFADRQSAVSDRERKTQERVRRQSQEYYVNVTNPSRNVTESREQKTEDREQKTETEAEQKPPSDALFDLFQRELELSGVTVNNASAIIAINKMIANGATIEDLRDGFKWKISNSDDRVIYATSLVGPTKTSTNKRRQHGTVPQKEYIGPNGEVLRL
jgi:hypothetical protein